MTLHSQAQALVDQIAAVGELDLAAMDIVESRAVMAAMRVPMDGIASGGQNDLTITMRDGAGIKARQYMPSQTSEKPAGLFVYFHGGGWVFGDLEGHDALCQTLANELQMPVVSVDYRLAPEHPFPTPMQDCFDALCWCAENAEQLGADGKRLVVGGDSAGGNLAAAVSIASRSGDGPEISAQVLYYPVTDRNFDRASYSENESGYLLTKKGMMYFWDSYLRDDDDANDPLAAPLQAPDLSNLPAAFVLTAAYDPLRDEGIAYAEALVAAGNKVSRVQHDDQVHGFVSMIGRMDSAMKAVKQTAKFLADENII